MRILNYSFAVIFVIFAALQYNDPDPWLWGPIYLYAAALCWQGAKGKYYPRLYWLGLLGYGIYAAILFFDKDGVISWATEHHQESIVQTMKAEKPWIEETREFGGLLIASAALIWNLVASRKKA
jgi:Transmembrane family 220, helix